MDLVRPSAIVSDTSSGQANIDIGHADSFSIVQSLDCCKSFCVLLHQVGQIGEIAASSAGVNFGPFSLEGLAGSSDGDIDIFLGGLMNSDDRFLVGRIDGLEGLPINAFHVFVVDEPEPRLSAKNLGMVGHAINHAG